MEKTYEFKDLVDIIELLRSKEGCPWDMHSQIAKEEGIFTMQDVIQEISQKMIRRHPHVFHDKLSKVLKKAEKMHYVQERKTELISSMSKTIESLRNKSEQEIEARKQEYIGALLLDISKLAKCYDVDAEEAHSKAVEGFIDDYKNQEE